MRNRSISLTAYSGRRVARDGRSKPRCVSRSIVGALTPMACAASSRVRASLGGTCVAPGCGGAPLVDSAFILFADLIASCNKPLLTADRSLSSRDENSQPVDCKMDKCESDRSQIGHFWALHREPQQLQAGLGLVLALRACLLLVLAKPRPGLLEFSFCWQA